MATVGRTKVIGLLLHSSALVNYNYSIFYLSKGFILRQTGTNENVYSWSYVTTEKIGRCNGTKTDAKWP